MSGTALQTIVAGTGADVKVNDNFASTSPAGLYSRDPVATVGLVWGYKGGNFNGNAVADGTVTLTASNTNYVVANRSTGAVTFSTGTTNWNDQVTYMRLYSVVVGSSTITSWSDYRQVIGMNTSFDEPVNAQTGASYAIATSDKGKIVTRSNAGAMSDTIAAASSGFGSGWACDYQNRGAGTVTLTPTTSTIDGGASLVLTSGQGCRLVSDGANYFTQRGMAAAGTGATLGAVNAFTKNQSVAPSSLTSGANIAVDASLSNNFKLVLNTNANLGNPTNLTDGMVLNFRVKQDSTGNRTLAFGSKYKWPSGTALVLSTTANAVDFFSAYYDSTDDMLECMFGKGFS